MQKLVSTIAGLTLLVSILSSGMPRVTHAADTANVPPPSWPHTITTDDATIVVYQPQAIAWKEYRTLETREAVAVTKKGAKAPVLGTLEASVDTHTDFDTRSVVFSNRQLLSSRFPSLDTEQAAAMEHLIQQAMAHQPPGRVPLDTILLSLKQQGSEAKGVALKNDPPVIFYSPKPANLVGFDGEPVMSPVQGTGLLFAVNTNWDVFLDPSTSTYYLLDGAFWLSAPSYTGPWQPVAQLPALFNDLPNDKNFEEVKEHIPGIVIQEQDMPAIFVSTQPAEIILTKGPPTFSPIRGTKLLYVNNTDSDLFQDSRDGQYYYLTSGRWFRSASLEGPWTFATPILPQDFASIPPDSPKGWVLVAVPETAQAEEAVLQAQIPRQATLKRSEATVDVTYSGAPQFKPIEGTTMTYATNTSFDVIRVDDLYYTCFQGAWFVSTTPKGPWKLTDSVPKEIYTIPPSNPLYHDTYVKVYSSSADDVVFGFTAGYLMGFVTAGVLAYGTGWYYPPYVALGPAPVYYPYPPSYVGPVSYNPYTGTYARGGTAYGPWGGAVSAGAAYNPATGAYGRGAAVYGPNGGVGAWSGYNPTTGTYTHGRAAWGPNAAGATGSFYNPRTGGGGATAQYSNPYGHWGRSVVSGPGGVAQRASRTTDQGTIAGFRSTTGARGIGVEGAGGQSAGIARGAGGNIYAGKDGNVYRRTTNGWSQWNDGSWNQIQSQPHTQARNPQAASGAGGLQNPLAGRSQGELSSQHAATYTADFTQLNQDHQARMQGAQRQQDFNAWRTSGQRAHDFGNRSFGQGFEGGGSRGGGRFGGGGLHGGFHR